MYYTLFDTPLCEIILAGDNKGLAHLHLNTGEGRRQCIQVENWTLNPDYFSDIQIQIMEYLDGRRQSFDVTLNPAGTPFQKMVWRQLLRIPYGQLVCYADIAKKLGNPNASRAVGVANSNNPIPLIIPCHRVVRADGGLGGFAHGLSIKEQLIALEKTSVLLA
ncbi:MAG: cysteine methyltransferase [Desulfobacterales bacterium]|nr:MAG: cysteine methyltransferase [Desulfobacterales bacterium]